MGLGDLFKSKEAREREAKKLRRKAFREAESAVDVVKGRIAKLKKEHSDSWEQARKQLRDGQKAGAQRSLQACRAGDMMMAKLETKRWVFEQLLTKLELAKTDQDFTKALGAIDVVVQIDPEQVADVFDAVEEKLGEQLDTDRIWEQAYTREMAGVDAQLTDVVPSMDELNKQLEDEVASEIGGRGRDVAGKIEDDSEIKDKISEGRKRLKDLMEDDK